MTLRIYGKNVFEVILVEQKNNNPNKLLAFTTNLT